MSNNSIPNEHVKKIIDAFSKDNFNVDENKGIYQFEEKLGILATHKTAVISKTQKKKKAYYVEGTRYQMGYLMGLMAEEEIAAMTTDFVKNLVVDFVTPRINTKLKKRIGEFLFDIVLSYTKNIEQDIPGEYKVEMKGILDGCKQANPDTTVEYDNLFVLNVGFDALMSVVYSGRFPKPKLKKLKKDAKKQLQTKIKLKPRIKSKPGKHLRIPIMCNGFSIFGEAIGGNSHRQHDRPWICGQHRCNEYKRSSLWCRYGCWWKLRSGPIIRLLKNRKIQIHSDAFSERGRYLSDASSLLNTNSSLGTSILPCHCFCFFISSIALGIFSFAFSTAFTIFLNSHPLTS